MRTNATQHTLTEFYLTLALIPVRLCDIQAGATLHDVRPQRVWKLALRNPFQQRGVVELPVLVRRFLRANIPGQEEGQDPLGLSLNHQLDTMTLTTVLLIPLASCQ